MGLVENIKKGSKEGKIVWDKVVTTKYVGVYEGYEIIVSGEEKTLTIMKNGNVEGLVKDAGDLLSYVEKNVGKKSLVKRIFGGKT